MKQSSLLTGVIAGLTLFLASGCNVLDNGASGVPWVEATVHFTEGKKLNPQFSVVDPGGSAMLCGVNESVQVPWITDLTLMYDCAMMDLGSKSATLVLPATKVRFIKYTYSTVLTVEQAKRKQSSTSSGLSAAYNISTGATDLVVNIDGDELAFDLSSGEFKKGVFKSTLYAESPLNADKYNWDYSGGFSEGDIWGFLTNEFRGRHYLTVSADGLSMYKIMDTGLVPLPFMSDSWGSGRVAFANGTISSTGANTNKFRPTQITKAEPSLVDRGTGKALTLPIYSDAGLTTTVKGVATTVTWTNNIPVETEIVTDGKTQFWKQVQTGAEDPENPGYYTTKRQLYQNTDTAAATPVWSLVYTMDHVKTQTTGPNLFPLVTIDTKTCKDASGNVAVYHGTAPSGIIYTGDMSFSCVFNGDQTVDSAQTTSAACTAAHPNESPFFGTECLYYPQYPKYVNTFTWGDPVLTGGQITNLYDAAGALKQSTVNEYTYYTQWFDSIKTQTTRVYDGAGNYYNQGSTHTNFTDGNYDVTGQPTTMVFYNRHKGTNKTMPTKQNVTFTRNSSGRLTKATYSNEDAPDFNIESVFTFDTKGRYAKMETYNYIGGVKGTTPDCNMNWSSSTMGANVTYSYATDASGNRTITKTDFCNGNTYSATPVKSYITVLDVNGQAIEKKTVYLNSTGTEANATSTLWEYTNNLVTKKWTRYTIGGVTDTSSDSGWKKYLYDTNNFQLAVYPLVNLAGDATNDYYGYTSAGVQGYNPTWTFTYK